jgi:hypothetical protein
VYEGKFTKQWYRDPHFHNSTYSPVARFRPDARGWALACELAASL